MKHDYYKAADITESDSWGQSNIVDGGLAVCKVCHGGEGGLTTDCPGEAATGDQHDAVYAGKLDYREGLGWVQELNPTNQMWKRGHRITQALANGLKCYATYELCEDCARCEDAAECKADTKGAPA